jgi:hypothetical protein
MMYISGKEVSSALAILRIEFQSSVGSNEHYVTGLSAFNIQLYCCIKQWIGLEVK